MGDIQNRPFSKNYSGLLNQSVIALSITALCVGGHELMKRRRRGKVLSDDLGSRESWEFGYLYQARSWAKYPTPPSPLGKWPFSWISGVVWFPEEDMNKLRGVDATLYIRFLRGCFWFALLHSCTTFPILFPIHVYFSDGSISPKSMTRASISSLVLTPQGLSLLWIHICLLFWITLSWMGTLFWVCNGAFRLRAADIHNLAERLSAEDLEPSLPAPHPHPPYGFTEVPKLDVQPSHQGLRCRTIMVSNVLPQLRDEKALKEYFEFYMSRKLEKPALGVNSTTQPGFINKSLSFLFNRAKRVSTHFPSTSSPKNEDDVEPRVSNENDSNNLLPRIERVTLVRKMTELASLLERREDILRLLETAHINLARKALAAVTAAMEMQAANKPMAISRSNTRAAIIAKQRNKQAEVEPVNQDDCASEEERMKELIRVLRPYVDNPGSRGDQPEISRRPSTVSRRLFYKLGGESTIGADDDTANYPPGLPSSSYSERPTVWDALLGLPRSYLDPYQPLVNLSHLFRGKTVPAIDYYTAKLNLLTALITENRAQHVGGFAPVSTAFVTFEDPADARRACKYLTVHPGNPLACMVSMAPQYQDLDWTRIMKSSYDVEFVKDWVVGIGVWGFTIFWLFPVSLLVGLVSIQNISTFWPQLKLYLERHRWEEEVIQSFLPTLLVALLALLIPLILLLIAKKAHNITTLSSLHDLIMTRYYKFLVVNVLVFFCVGTAAVQSVLQSFSSTVTPDVIKIVASSFPSAGPFYVGWMIFTMAMHGGFEIALFGLPLILYPTTRRQVTPRKRAVGTRPRTLNYYYWLPTHLLVVHTLLLFSLLNPFVLPFGCIYFFLQIGVMKNQLLHVYAKNYEGKGKLILIRLVRYSLDGLVLCQAVFLAYMVVLKKSVNVGLAAFLIVFTVTVKIIMTRMCRAQFEADDILEANVACRLVELADERVSVDAATSLGHEVMDRDGDSLIRAHNNPINGSKLTWKVPLWMSFSYDTFRHKPNRKALQRQPIPSNLYRPSQLSRTSNTSIPTVHRTTPSGTARPYSSEFPIPKQSPQAPSPPPVLHIADDRSGPVVPHPRLQVWDDLTNADLPYDNPFYTREISNYLWLPRNPCAKLNLDDTVDMKVSLTVEANTAPLGTWTGLPVHSSPVQTPYSISSRSSIPGISEPAILDDDDDIDGTEDIELPPMIARRVSSRDGNIESVQRSPGPSRQRRATLRSTLSTRSFTSSNPDTKHSTKQRRPTTGSSSLRVPGSFRSFSGNSRPRVSSMLSAIEHNVGPLQPPLTSDVELGLRPDMHAQANLVIDEHINASQNSLAQRPSILRGQSISAQQAIAREVLAEEQEAFVRRIEEEQTEAGKPRARRSFMTSWFFRRAE